MEQNLATLGSPSSLCPQDELEALPLKTNFAAASRYWSLNKSVSFNPVWNTTTYILDKGPLARLVQSISWAPGDDGADWRLLCRVEQTGKYGSSVSPFIIKLPNEDEYTMVFVRSSKNCMQLDCRPLEMPNLVIRTEQILDGGDDSGESSSDSASEPSYPHGTSLTPQIIISLTKRTCCGSKK